MDAFIQLRVGADGELTIMIHKALWEDLRRGEVVEEDEYFISVALKNLTRSNLMEIAASGGTQNYPCRRVFQLEVEI